MVNTENLLKIANIRQFAASDVITEEGDAGEDMFIILKGSVALYKNYRQDNEIQLDTIASGGFFGEMSLFLGKKRTATAVAVEDVVVLSLGRLSTHQFFIIEPDLAFSIMEKLFERVNKLSAACEEHAARTGGEGKPPIKEYAFKVNNPAGACLFSYKKGEVLSKGAPKNTYFLLSGKARLYFNYGKSGELVLGELTAGNFFGESLLGSVSSVAIEPVLLLVLNRKDAPGFFTAEPLAAFRIMEVLCDRIEMLSHHYDSLFSGNLTEDGYRSHILFPDGHKTYSLGIKLRSPLLFEKRHTCPICKKSFKAFAPQVRELPLLSVDDDFRMRYDGVDPIYYEALSCPDCWFSAPEEYFSAGYSPRYLLDEKLAPYKNQIKFSFQHDINSVFTSYYLSTVITPLCYTVEKPFIMGKLWHRIAWLYDDCGDNIMRDMAFRYALNYYSSTYDTLELPPKHLFPIMTIIGVLNHRLGKHREAVNILNKAAYMKGGTESGKAKITELLKKYRSVMNV
jgi:CRP-like cAMP-binding protein/uncharacterized protein (DUF2225 family)